jgi:hypothetical protein
MKYRTGLKNNDFEGSLFLTKDQVTRLNNAIKKAYDSLPDGDFSIDEINGLVAPYIKTQEEAYYVASIVVAQVLSTATNLMPKYN